jgi:hypothetical protein
MSRFYWYAYVRRRASKYISYFFSYVDKHIIIYRVWSISMHLNIIFIVKIFFLSNVNRILIDSFKVIFPLETCATVIKKNNLKPIIVYCKTLLIYNVLTVTTKLHIHSNQKRRFLLPLNSSSFFRYFRFDLQPYRLLDFQAVLF